MMRDSRKSGPTRLRAGAGRSPAPRPRLWLSLAVAVTAAWSADNARTQPGIQAPSRRDAYAAADSLLRDADRNTEARRAALDRFQLLDQLRRRLGIPFYDVMSVGSSIPYFPAGRSDRVYVDVYRPETRAYRLDCCELRGGKARLVYRLDLKEMPVKSHPAGPVRSVADLLCVEGLTPRRPVARAVSADMERKQDLVRYDPRSEIQDLKVAWMPGMSRPFMFEPPFF